MNRIILIILIAITACTCVPAIASDLSESILHAGQWPKQSKLPPGAVRVWAPPGTITTVERWSKGTFIGENSKGHWVWAVPTRGTYFYIRACNCNNPITGSKPMPITKLPELPKQQPEPVKLPEPEKSIKIISSDLPEPEEKEVRTESPAPVVYFPPTRLEQKPYSPVRLPEWEIKSKEALTVSMVLVPTIQVNAPPPVKIPPPVVGPCPPPVTLPTKPPTSAPVGNPSGLNPGGPPAPNGPPPPTGAQAPVVIGNPSVTWNVTPAAPTVAASVN